MYINYLYKIVYNHDIDTTSKKLKLVKNLLIVVIIFIPTSSLIGLTLSLFS